MNMYYNKDNNVGISISIIDYWKLNPHLGNGKKATEKEWKDEVILSRLHIGHTRTTHSYLKQSNNQHVMHARPNIL